MILVTTTPVPRGIEHKPRAGVPGPTRALLCYFAFVFASAGGAATK